MSSTLAGYIPGHAPNCVPYTMRYYFEERTDKQLHGYRTRPASKRTLQLIEKLTAYLTQFDEPVSKEQARKALKINPEHMRKVIHCMTTSSVIYEDGEPGKEEIGIL